VLHGEPSDGEPATVGVGAGTVEILDGPGGGDGR
jgi:hypothetical protein